MTNDEIRVKVAELCGYKRMYGFMDTASSQEHEYWITPEGNKTTIIPNYPGEISDAMGLIVEIQSEPYLQAIQITRVPAIGKRWVMWVGANITETGDTLPMAICLAYIQWKESQK